MMKAILIASCMIGLTSAAFAEEGTVATETIVAAAAAPATVETGATTTTGAMAPAAVDTAKLAENEIPLAIGEGKKMAEAGSSTSKALLSGMIIVVLLAASYYYVRRYKTSNTINQSNMQIKVLTQHYLGPKKSLAIVRVAGESILIGVTDTNISMIKALSLLDDEIPSELPNSFADSMGETTPAATASSTGARAKTAMVDELDEEFSFAGVTDTVSKKIKSMRSFS